MADTKVEQNGFAGRLRQWMVPTLILAMAVAVVFLIAGNWNAWAGEKAEQETDDAYTRADLTPLSTKVAGLGRPPSPFPIIKASKPATLWCSFVMTTSAHRSSRPKRESPQARTR